MVDRACLFFCFLGFDCLCEITCNARSCLRQECNNEQDNRRKILPQNSLDIGFANQPVMTRTASVSWCDGDSQKWSLTVELPDHQNAGVEGRPMSLIYIIYSSGRVDAHLLESIKVK
jgi:hypothetical protein